MTGSENWPLYRGTKTLKAVPMTKAEYCLLRGWQVPENEDPTEKGYVVEYQDGGAVQPEMKEKGFTRYVSWSPADVFEEAYRRCDTHIDRMKIERDELHDRITKLEAFTKTDTFKGLDGTEQFRMNKQLQAMIDYRRYLIERIVAADVTGKVAEPTTQE